MTLDFNVFLFVVHGTGMKESCPVRGPGVQVTRSGTSNTGRIKVLFDKDLRDYIHRRGP